jgi:hypothetical protein
MVEYIVTQADETSGSVDSSCLLHVMKFIFLSISRVSNLSFGFLLRLFSYSC